MAGSDLQSYLDSISTYDKEFKGWENRVEKILKRYRDEQRQNKDNIDSKFNILWSNVQTLVPATFSRLPVPDVTRRFRDNDPIGRVAALILERALDFEVQHYVDYKATLGQSVHDRFLGGRGTAWVRYEPHFRAMDEPVNGVQITEDIDEPEVKEQLDYECAPIDYVAWRDFGHNVARTWEEVTQVWRVVYMNESAVVARFGEELAKKIPYDATPEELRRASREQTIIKKQAQIYELWDKEKNIAVWICKGLKEVLDTREDPLGLQDFFPCPKPLFATMTNESLIPIPDFTLYQDQAITLDVLSDRIGGLARMLQLKGVYDAAEPSLARLFTEGGNGDLLPIKNYAGFSEKGGLAGGIDLVDLTQLAQAMQLAQETMEQVKNQVYEITGISDIIRGQSEASETATAQQIKSQFGSLRLKETQRGVSEYATDILRLKAQVMCCKFDPKTITAMAAVEQLSQEDQQLVPQAMMLLVGQERMMNPEAESPNPMRAFRIEIAADTLVELDEQQEKQDRMEFLKANGDFMTQAMGMMAQAGPAAPILAPVVMELWKFGITAFKVGKSMEGTMDQAADKLKELAKNPPPPQPNPDVMKIQAQQQMDQQKLQAEGQREQQRMVAEQQRAQAELQHQAASEMQQAQREEQIAIREHERELAKIRSDANLEELKAGYDQDTEIKKVAMQVAGQIEVAKINAQAKAQTDALNAEASVEAAKVSGEAQVKTAETTAKNTPEPSEGIDANKIMEQLLATHTELIKAVSAPKRIKRDAEGRAETVETVRD